MLRLPRHEARPRGRSHALWRSPPGGLAALAALILAAGGGLFAGEPAAAASAAATAGPQCGEPAPLDRQVDRLHVTGNQLLDGENHVFTPDGISVFGGLQDGGGGDGWEQTLPGSIAQIKASALYWHSNTVRIPISEGNLFLTGQPGHGYNMPFLDALCSEVRLARSLHMVVVITDQTEFPDWAERNPQERTIRFWDVIAREYANQPGIMFDPFNEPRQLYRVKVARNTKDRAHRLKVDHAFVWHLWQQGGRAAGRTFVGMQQLVDAIRATGARNVMEIEGPFYADTLNEAGHYPIHGTNLTWAIHHPPLNGVASWTLEFGYLAVTRPVEINEWSQYASTRPECRPNAYDMVPRFLHYAHSLGMGVLGWSLQPGSLVAEAGQALPTNTTNPNEPVTAAALSVPNRLWPDYSCTQRRVGEGVGQTLMNYLARYSRRPS